MVSNLSSTEQFCKVTPDFSCVYPLKQIAQQLKLLFTKAGLVYFPMALFPLEMTFIKRD